MKSKTSAKVFLDGAMLVLLALMYSYRAISPTFHEVGGLALGGMFIIHCLVNATWISGVTKRIATGRLPKKTVLKWAIDVLLAVCMIIIIVSGVFISRTVLTNITSSSTIWKSLHVPISIIALILAGIHLGLSWSTVQKTIRVKFPAAVSSLLCLLLVAGGAFGAYTLDIPQKMFSGTTTGIHASSRNGGQPPTGAGVKGTRPSGTAPTGTPGGGTGTAPTNSGSGGGGIVNVLWYGLFMSLFSVVTYYIDKLIHRNGTDTSADARPRHSSEQTHRRAPVRSRRPVQRPRS